MKFRKVLVANRGEIARRILRSCHANGYQTVAVYSEADCDMPHVFDADEAICIGPAGVLESYSNIDKIIAAARKTGAEAIHPGYGLLSERPDFAQACNDAGIVFIGPTPKSMELMSSKSAARALMQQHGVPVVPGYQGNAQDIATLVAQAKLIGFPLLLKPAQGGGGKGMRIVLTADSLVEAIEASKREAKAVFGDDELVLERYLTGARHIEFQIIGDLHGNLLHAFERECSIQRRQQKVIEEAPSPFLTPELRKRMAAAALQVARAVNYTSVGTVEFIVLNTGEFYFLEMNTRLQVEHPVTELTTGLDLVALQLEIAQGKPLLIAQKDIVQIGAAIECRLIAEDAANQFFPQSGKLHDVYFPQDGVRVDSGYVSGDCVSVYYDSLLAKIISYGNDRADAILQMQRCLFQTSILGPRTNKNLLLMLLQNSDFIAGDFDTGFLENHLLMNPLCADGKGEWALIIATLAIAQARRHLYCSDEIALGFRNNRFSDSEEKWFVNDEKVSVFYRELAPKYFSVTINSNSYNVQVKKFDLPQMVLDIDGHVVKSRVIIADSVYVHVDGAELVLCNQPHLQIAAKQAARGERCIAPMPGKVIDICIEIGSQLVTGDAVMVLEAMKMQHVIRAHRDVVITEILVEKGEIVVAQAELVRFASA